MWKGERKRRGKRREWRVGQMSHTRNPKSLTRLGMGDRLTVWAATEGEEGEEREKKERRMVVPLGVC